MQYVLVEHLRLDVSDAMARPVEAIYSLPLKHFKGTAPSAVSTPMGLWEDMNRIIMRLQQLRNL